MIWPYRSIAVILIGLLVGCDKKPATQAVVSKDTLKTQPDKVSPVVDTAPEDSADGKYSRIIKDGNTTAEIFYTVKDSHVDYYKLTVRNGSNVQKLHAVSNWGFSGIDQTEFSFQDVNFDGKKDLLIAHEIGMNWGTSRVWINKNGQFIREKKFKEIKNPVFDSIKKEIRSEYRVSGVGEFSNTYRWKKGHLILTDSSEYIYGPDGN
ncbi:MAG: hypothetical protein LBE92_04855 [Chryseobacterium sp.]|jgi:hypothetical protein|uniref:XAC2610-related protein n=1 Tax=Chryseobacterium sp. TaxID=1871047 RepID=UPI002838CB77|nr:hypothetical protein [Chryseobacterium sp.]MDR2235429.1 hypothetical protein [Chryseobacterium sp.]